MRLLALIFVTFMSLANSKAQITVTNSTFPVAGDTLYTALDTAPGNLIVFPLAAGNQYWNLFPVTADIPDTTVFKPANQGPQFENFSSAELVAIDAFNNQIYFDVTPTKMDQIGYAGPDIGGFGIAASVNFVPPLRYRTAPLSFGDLQSFESNIEFPLNTAFLPDSLGGIITFDSIRIRIHINRIEFVDAFGNLTLPGGTFPVLRQRRFEVTETRLDAFVGGFVGWLDITDALPFDGLGKDTTLSYTFYSNTYKEPMAVVTLDADSSVAAIRYKLMPPSNSADLGEFKSPAVYPNPVPAGHSLHIVAHTSALTEPRLYELVDMQGRLIWQQTGSANENLQLPLEGLKTGTYLLHVVDPLARRTLLSQRILIE